MNSGRENTTGDVVIFVYDGDCPLCNHAAHALHIRKNIGPLELVDARHDRDNPVLSEIRDQNLNLDDGMVIKYRARFYHGDAALVLMARLGRKQGWFNRINAAMFKNPSVAKIAYPLMRAGRNLLLVIKRVPRLNNLHIKQ